MSDSQKLHYNGMGSFLQSVLILLAMAGLFGFLGYRMFGTAAAVFGGLIGIGAAVAGIRNSPNAVLASRNIQTLRYRDAPALYTSLAALSQKAALPVVPTLGFLRSGMVNSFTVGDRHNAVIVVTRGMLSALSSRQVAAVLAHEVAHIKNGDIKLLTFADALRRITSLVSRAGIFILFLSIPLALFTSTLMFPFSLVLALLGVPLLSQLLQLYLSRSREYAADAVASDLTGDPGGLASALAAIDRPNRTLLDYFYSRPVLTRRDEGVLFRSHPPTSERIRRLEARRNSG